MKRTKYRKYQVPRVSQARLEAEGIICHSAEFNLQVYELDHVNQEVDSDKQGTSGDPFYLDF